jgi:hypothetical protein
VIKEINKFDVDIIAMKQTRNKFWGREEIDRFKNLNSGVPKEDSAEQEVAFLIKKTKRT